MDRRVKEFNVGDLIVVDARHTADDAGGSIYVSLPTAQDVSPFSYVHNGLFVLVIYDKLCRRIERDYACVVSSTGAVGWIMATKLKQAW